LHFAVSDTGIGIPPDKLSVIFEAFSQADNSITRKYGGTGLGLAISTHLAQLMKGKLTAESRCGKGSTFHFTARLGIGKESSSHPDIAYLKRREVLVADENATSRRVLQKMLLHWNMKPTVVDCGEAAIAVLQDASIPFDYILLGKQMPDIDGFSIAQFAKENCPNYFNSTFIMMLSSTAQRSLEKHSTSTVRGCLYLNKPVGPDELLSALLQRFSKELNAVSQFEIKPQSPSSLTRVDKYEKILLAEDNVVNQRLAIRMLEKLGYTVVLAENGLKAVHAVEREKFDLILMDVQMPVMGGFEATAKIRELESKREHKRTPILAMTAHAIQGYREKCLKASMDGYISKPIHMESMQKTIEEFLGAAKQRVAISL